MTQPRWDRIKEVFNAALAVPQADRSSLIARLCSDDDELRREVESLVEARTLSVVRTGGAADALAAITTASNLDPHAADRVGTTIHRYKLLQIIGEGGFGTVYMAEQTEPVRRKVALKVIKPGMDSRAIIARFEAERQALALMDHPHIARVLDGGVTPLTESGGGLPYFVMEYVVGDAVTRFADAHALSIAERLALFQQVCSAVQHAHTKGIIHRDLKPANVIVSMVDGKPFAKVIDFGIAKATGAAGGRLTDMSFFTEHRQLIGTPEYMSPEQAEGSLDIDTRTDVYALGVLLYELLTGTTPIEGARLRSAAFDEMRRMIREDEPLAPSMKLSRSLDTLARTAASRKVEPARLSTLVKGELDWIVLKALEKERARRYETPSALAEDVRRHLAGEAVQAAPVSRTYRMRKFVRKNKGPVAASAGIAATLLVGIAGTAWQWREARAGKLNAERVRDILEVAANRAGTSMMPGLDVRLGDKSLLAEGAKVPTLTRVGVTRSDGRALTEDEQLAAWTAEMLVSSAESLKAERDRLASQRDRANEGVGQMMSILTGGATAGPIVSSSPDGEASQTDPLERAIGMGVQMAGSLKAERDTLARQRDMMTSALESLYKPGSVVENMTQASALGVLMAIRATDDYKQVRPEDRAAWELAQLATYTTRQMVDRTDAAEWSAYTATLSLAQATMLAFDYPEAREILGRSPSSRRGWEFEFLDLQSRAVVVCIAGAGERSNAWVDEVGMLAIQPLRGNPTVQAWGIQRGSTFAVRPLTPVDTQLQNRLDRSSVGLFTPAFRDWIRNRSPNAVDVDGQRWLLAKQSCNHNSRSFVVDLRRREALRWRSALVARGVASDEQFTGLVLPWGQNSGNLALIAADQLGGPEYHDADRPELFVAAILASSPNGPSGLAITTPDGSRRIVGGADKTVRFFEAKEGKPTLPATAEQPQGVYREVAVFRMNDAVTNLQMTGDGTRLIIHLQDGSARVWDIRDPQERRKDLQAEWAERVPVGAYLDTLCASETPDDMLCDAAINDASLTPLRRLVAAEMLEERLEDDRLAAEQAFEKMKQAAAPAGAATGSTPAADPASITSAVRAAAAAAELPKRVKARVISLAARWEYTNPEATAEQKLAEENKQRRLTEATLTVERFQSWDTPGYPGDLADLEGAVATRDELLGKRHAESAKARWMLGIYTFARGADLDTERRGVALMQHALTHYRDAAPLSDITLGMQISLAQAQFWTGDLAGAEGSLRRAIVEVEGDAALPSPRFELIFASTDAGGWGFGPDFHGKNLLPTSFRFDYSQTFTANRERFVAENRKLLDAGLLESAMRAGTAISLTTDVKLDGARSEYVGGSSASVVLARLAAADARVYLPLALHRYRTQRLAEALIAAQESVRRCVTDAPRDDGWGPSRCNPVLQQGVVALIRHRLSTADDATLAAAAEIDAKPNSLTGGKVLDRRGHRVAAREALAKAHALMAPAANGSPSSWANDERAKTLLAEAEALIEPREPRP